VCLREASALGVDKHCNFGLTCWDFLQHSVDVERANWEREYVSEEIGPSMLIVGTAFLKKLSEDGSSLESLARADIYNKI
jgi:hypothetical protein